MRPRSASEWRSFWHRGGEAELRAELLDAWTPLRDAAEDVSAHAAERIALLLGSSAPVRAIAAELGRIRVEVGAAPDAGHDGEAAERIDEWFRTRSR